MLSRFSTLTEFFSFRINTFTVNVNINISLVYLQRFYLNKVSGSSCHWMLTLKIVNTLIYIL